MPGSRKTKRDFGLQMTLINEFSARGQGKLFSDQHLVNGSN